MAALQLSILLVSSLLIQTCLSQFKPPVIKEPSQKFTKNVLPKSSLSLKCTATGTPTPSYEWMLNGQILATGSVFQVDKDNGGLTILSFTEDEEGEYQCLAAVRVTDYTTPVAVSQPVILKTVRLGNSGIQKNPEQVFRKEGEYASLKCEDVPESVPEAKFSWFLESTNGNKQQVTEDFRRYVDSEGTLHFMYLETSDQQHIMLYKCAVYNSMLDTIKLGSPKDLRVSSVTSKPQVKPMAQFHTNPAVFLRKDTAKLECVFSGFPEVTVTWLDRQGNRISNNEKFKVDETKQGRVLYIMDVQEEDEGDYTCRGENSVGKTDAGVVLDVTSGPIWENGLSYQTVTEGKTALFRCSARPAYNEDPLNPPVWYKNGLPLSSQTGKLEFSDRGRELRVVNVEKPYDIMCIQCNVSNTVGFEYSNGCLNVIEPIVIETSPPPLQSLKKGDQADLTLVATSDPDYPLSRRWKFKNRTYELYPPLYVTYDDRSQRAYINTTELTEAEFASIEGVYTIELYNVYEMFDYTVELIIGGPPITGAPVVEGRFPWWAIVVLILLILLIVVILLIVFCCCRNKDKGAYRVYKTETKTPYLHPDDDIEENKFHAMTQLVEPEDKFDPQKKRPLPPHYDLSGDEADSLDGYAGGKSHVNFNEDGSFIGLYTSVESQDL